jgi:hypothetical protein
MHLWEGEGGGTCVQRGRFGCSGTLIGGPLSLPPPISPRDPFPLALLSAQTSRRRLTVSAKDGRRGSYSQYVNPKWGVRLPPTWLHSLNHPALHTCTSQLHFIPGGHRGKCSRYTERKRATRCLYRSFIDCNPYFPISPFQFTPAFLTALHTCLHTRAHTRSHTYSQTSSPCAGGARVCFTPAHFHSLTSHPQLKSAFRTRHSHPPFPRTGGAQGQLQSIHEPEMGCATARTVALHSRSTPLSHLQFRPAFHQFTSVCHLFTPAVHTTYRWGAGGLYVQHFTLNVGCAFIRPTPRAVELMERVAARLSLAAAWDQEVRLRERSLHPRSFVFRHKPHANGR